MLVYDNFDHRGEGCRGTNDELDSLHSAVPRAVAIIDGSLEKLRKLDQTSSRGKGMPVAEDTRQRGIRQCPIVSSLVSHSGRLSITSRIEMCTEKMRLHAIDPIRAVVHGRRLMRMRFPMK